MTISRSEHPGDTLKRLLWAEWDPIGVRGLGPDDEFDSYALRLSSMLKEGASETEIAAYLRWAAIENMGLRNAGDVEAVARSAIAIHKDVK